MRCLAKVLVAAALVAPLVACRPPVTEEKGVVEIQFWNGFSGPDGKAMEQIVRDFNASQSEVRVKMQIIPWGTYYDKVTLGLASKDAPEVFVVHAPRIAEFATHGVLEPLDTRLQSSSLGEADFVPLAWKAGQWEGKRYALPLDCHPLGMYYNVDLFRKAGIEHPPKTRDEFLDAARKLTVDANGDGQPEQWGFAVTDLHLTGATLFSQFGAGLLDADLRRCDLDNERGQEAVTFLRDLMTHYRVAPQTSGDDSWVAFQTGRAAMAFQGIWMIDALERQSNLHYAAAPVPILGPHKKVWAGAHVLAMPAAKSERRKEAGWRFIRYLSDHSLVWAKGGQIPVRLAILESPEFRALKVQSAFAEQLDYVEFEPFSPASNQIATFADIAVQSVCQGLSEPKAALTQACTRVNRVMERQ